MKRMLIIKTFVVHFGSYLVLRLLYDRLVWGYIDIRQKSLLELFLIPLGLTLLFWLSARLMNIRITKGR